MAMVHKIILSLVHNITLLVMHIDPTRPIHSISRDYQKATSYLI